MEADKKRKTYDREFWVNAVNLVMEGGRKVRELGIDPNTLYHWKRELLEERQGGFPGKRAIARSSIFEYIEIFYSRVRRHSALGRKSPVAFEQSHFVAFLTARNTG
ncbi:MAG: hypothetical protein HBSIN02_25140 [Bacteroidia bacterium]|nr:MAG: hypothetical protein HBSIN02_25140 [Bacteroidia bacterium]